VVMAFMEFSVHDLSQQERGDPVSEDEVWKHEVGYIKWFYRASHPIMISPAPVADYTALVPPYEEVNVEQQWVRQQIISNISARVESAMGVPYVFSNSVVAGIMDGIWSEYSILQEVSVSRRRTRSDSPQNE